MMKSQQQTQQRPKIDSEIDDDFSDFDNNDDNLSYDEDDDSSTADETGASVSGGAGGGVMDDADFEDKAVSCFRFFVMFLLIGGMIAAGVGTWKFLQQEEYDDFEHEVRNRLLKKKKRLTRASETWLGTKECLTKRRTTELSKVQGSTTRVLLFA